MSHQKSFNLVLFFWLLILPSDSQNGTENLDPHRVCMNVGSLQELLTTIDNVAVAMSEVVQMAKHSTDFIAGTDGFPIELGTIYEWKFPDTRVESWPISAQDITDDICGISPLSPTEDSLCVKALPDCAALHKTGFKKNGVYRIWPRFFNQSLRAYCDMETDGGGWTLIQRRGDYGDKPRNFFETWENYKKGFGVLEEDFWLGNDAIFALTNQANTVLRIDLEDFENEKRFAKYQNFLVRSELEKYRMTLGNYDGNAGDSMSVHSNQNFSTKDRDEGCAENFKGGWWYAGCHEVNINGLYHRGPHTSYADGVNWFKFRGFNYSLKATEMKIRPCNC